MRKISKGVVSPGERLRSIREGLRLTLREVEQQSGGIARELRYDKYKIPSSRLHQIEADSTVPSIFRAYTLSRIYGISLERLLGMYGIPR